MVYLFGWFATYFGLMLQGLSRYRGRTFLYCLLAYFAALAFLRGNVGTDTANYQLMLADFIHGYIWDGREPGFVVLGWALASLSPSVEVATRVIALVFFALLAVFVARSDRNERFLFMVYILPAFAYLYSMNVLRIGLASAFLLLAVQQIRIHGSASALKFGLLALLFHYSSALSLLYIAISQRTLLRFSSLLGVLILLSLVGSAFLMAEFYIMDKVAQYQTAQASGAMSGLSKIAIVVLFIAAIMLGRLPIMEKSKLIVLGLVLTILGWAGSQISYAGLRVLDLISFAMPLSILASYTRYGLEFEKLTKLLMVFSGILSTFSIYRGFVLEYGEGKSPFLPYEMYDFGLL